MSAPLLVTADEVNCLIFAYLQDSGFQHSAFAIRVEGRLEQSSHFSKHIPRGELVELLSKALLYVEVETHWKGNSMTSTCQTGFSLLEPHFCSATAKPKGSAPAARSSTTKEQTNGDSGAKRKADSPTTTEDAHVEKRARRSAEAMDVDTSTVQEPESPFIDIPIPPRKTIIHPNPLNIIKPRRTRQTGPADDTTDPESWHLIQGHKSEIFVSTWNPVDRTTLVTGSKDGIVHVWNIPIDAVSPPPDSKPLKIAYFSKPEQGDLTSLDWNFDGSLLAIGSYDSILRVCTASGKLYFSHRQHEGPIFATKFSKSGQWLLTASLDGTACVWNIKTKKLHMQYRSHTDCCLDVDWLDDSTFASCGADRVIHVTNISDKKPIKTLLGHTNEVNQIKSNPTKKRLASCSDDQTARIWDVSDLINGSSDVIPGLSQSDRVIVLEGHEHSVSSIAWCPKIQPGDIELIATASFDSTCRLWNAATGECLKIFLDHTRPVYALTFSPDGRWLGTGSGDGWLHIYSVKTKKKKWSWFAGNDKPGVFEISWQQTQTINRIGLALERHEVGLVDLTRVAALQDDS